MPTSTKKKRINQVTNNLKLLLFFLDLARSTTSIIHDTCNRKNDGDEVIRLLSKRM